MAGNRRLFAVDLGDGVFQRLVQHRHHPVQHFDQVEADMLALVLHAGADRRGIGGLPGRGQRHPEARGVGGLFAGRTRAVQPVDQAGDHQLLLFQQRAPHRFGGMRGEHRLDVDARQPLREFVDAHALRLQPQQHVLQAFRLRLAAVGALVVAAATDAMHALGDVDHLEVRAERADQAFGMRGFQAGQQSRQRLRRRVALAARDGGGAHAFDFIQERGRDLLGQHVADQRAQPAHVFTKRYIGGSELETMGRIHRGGGPDGGVSSQHYPNSTRVCCTAARLSRDVHGCRAGQANRTAIGPVRAASVSARVPPAAPASRSDRASCWIRPASAGSIRAPGSRAIRSAASPAARCRPSP